MTHLYLISGFLGSGKTTFIKHLVTFFKDEKLALIINEFGAKGIDGKLLSDLSVIIREVNNGSIFCACRLEQFESALKELLLDAPSIIIVEASGLSDPTIIKKVLQERAVFNRIHYKGSICVVDTKTFPKVINTALVCKKQLLAADIVLLNKTDLVTIKEKNAVIDLIYKQKPSINLYETEYGVIPEEMKQTLINLTTSMQNAKAVITKDITLQRYLLVLSPTIDMISLTGFLNAILSDTYRIKGFVLIDKVLYYVDAVQNSLKVQPFIGEANIDSIQNLVVLSGNGMNTANAIKEASSGYKNLLVSVD